MTKKQYIIEVLKKLEPYRSAVTEYLSLIQSPSCTEENIENIFRILEKNIHDIQNADVRKKVQEIFAIIKEIHEKEQISIQQDLKDIEVLLAWLDQI
jgi:hypothetical protein